MSMKFKIGQNVKVLHCYSGADFEIGDIVKIVGIGFEADPDCYECVDAENLEGIHWYLYDDEVTPVSKADKIRSMGDDELAEFLDNFSNCSRCRKYGNDCFPTRDVHNWLKENFNNEF